jgi:hypothetical protein
VGISVGAALGGVKVVTVSGGRGVVRGALGGAVGFGVEDSDGPEVTEVTGAPRVAFVDALSPLLMMTAVATAPMATTAPMIAASGRKRRSSGQARSP